MSSPRGEHHHHADHAHPGRLLFVGGKGGVGKTTTASAMALQAARRGRRTLLVSTDPAHSLGDIFDREIGDGETRLAPDLIGCEIDPDATTRKHIEGVKRLMRRLVSPELYGEVDRQMEMASAAPGAAEAAVLERMARLTLEGLEPGPDGRARFDLVIFDTAPTGHTLRLLTLPEAMAAWTDGMMRQSERSRSLGRFLGHFTRRQRAQGPGLDLPLGGGGEAEDPRAAEIAEVLQRRRSLFHRLRHLLLDHDVSDFVFVLTPEKLPILETGRAVEALAQFRLPVRHLVVNRILPREAEGGFMARRRAQQQSYLAEIDERFAGLRQARLELLDSDVQGVETLYRLGRQIERQFPELLGGGGPSTEASSRG